MKNHKIKIIFILPSLLAGGAERVMSFVAQNVDKSIFNVTLLVVGFEKETKYDIKGIKVVFLNKSRVLKAIPKLFLYLQNAKPDIAISAIGHLNNAMGILAVFFPKIKFISREVNVNSVLKKYSEPVRRINFSSLFTKLSNRLLDKIICQSNDMAEDLRINYNVKPSKIIVINNPITHNFKIKTCIENCSYDVLQLITIGRLAKQKGHLRILKALKELKFPFHYTLIGDGPEKNTIFDSISNYGLSENVTHVPFTKKVQEYLARSHIFLLGSYVEGFPNALIESCAVGTPVVAFKAPGGIDEIVLDGINGYIANDLIDYIDKINLLAQSIQNWKPSEVSDSVYSRYNSNKIIKEYENLFVEILK